MRADTGPSGSGQIVTDRTLPDANAKRDLAMTLTGGLQPQDFSDLPHGHPYCWHRFVSP